jgi:hypothetical protein
VKLVADGVDTALDDEARKEGLVEFARIAEGTMRRSRQVLVSWSGAHRGEEDEGVGAERSCR